MGFLKIDGMTTSATAENNLSIKGLYECVPFYDEEPNKIILDNYRRGRFEDRLELYNEFNETCHVFYNKHTRIEKGDVNELRVFYKKYRDPFSGKTYSSDRMMELKDAHIPAEYYMVYDDTIKENSIPCMYYFYNAIAFFCKCENNYKKNALALKLIEKRLEKTEGQNLLSVELMSKLGKEYFSRVESVPSDFQLEYKEEFPKIVSIDQLKKLYDAGLIEISQGTNHDGVFIVLSDEVFDNDGVSGMILRTNYYKTKEDMKKQKQTILNICFN